MIDVEMTCPAATRFDPPGRGVRVVCGELRLAAEAHPRRLGLDAAVFDSDRDPAVILARCAGDGVCGSARSYAGCPIWQKAAEARMERKLFDQGRRGTAEEVA